MFGTLYHARPLGPDTRTGARYESTGVWLLFHAFAEDGPFFGFHGELQGQLMSHVAVTGSTSLVVQERESSLHVTNTTYSGLQEHRIIVQETLLSNTEKRWQD
jgi:hypothetical protein